MTIGDGEAEHHHVHLHPENGALSILRFQPGRARHA
jgi:hypothetical protein